MTPEQIAAMIEMRRVKAAIMAMMGDTTVSGEEVALCDLIEAQAAELAAMLEAMGTNCNPLTDADRAYIIAHLSYELEPVGKPPTWNQLAMEVIRRSNELATLRAERDAVKAAGQSVWHQWGMPEYCWRYAELGRRIAALGEALKGGA